MDRQKIVKQISALFESQRLGVLSTLSGDQPYASLIAFDASRDTKQLYFLTPNTTRKYDNLITHPKVSILVNDSRNKADDIYNAAAVTGLGMAVVADKASDKTALAAYLDKHPHLEEFSRAPTTAFVRVNMDRYFLVNRFQNVTDFKVGP